MTEDIKYSYTCLIYVLQNFLILPVDIFMADKMCLMYFFITFTY